MFQSWGEAFVVYCFGGKYRCATFVESSKGDYDSGWGSAGLLGVLYSPCGQAFLRACYCLHVFLRVQHGSVGQGLVAGFSGGLRRWACVSGHLVPVFILVSKRDVIRG